MNIDTNSSSASTSNIDKAGPSSTTTTEMAAKPVPMFKAFPFRGPFLATQSNNEIKHASHATAFLAQTKPNELKKVLDAEEFKKMADFMLEFKGLAVDCELGMLHCRRGDLSPLVIKGMVEAMLGNRLKQQYNNYKSRGKKYLRTYENQAEYFPEETILLKLARSKCLGPILLCRLVLQAKYPTATKEYITKIMFNWHLIEDFLLAVNVKVCVSMDILEGPEIVERQLITEDSYRGRIVQINLNQPDQPDFIMRRSFMYKDAMIYWVASIAAFGVVDSHKLNMKQKFKIYNREYGPGMVIYWYGYQKDILDNPDNENCVTIECDFPNPADIKFFA